MTTTEALRQARALHADDPAVRFTALTLHCQTQDALAIERIETLLMADDIPNEKRHVIERNLLKAVRQAQRRAS